jgi:hypothetical protein
LCQNRLQQCQQALQLEQRAETLGHGQAQPQSAAEALQLAQFCQQFRHYPAAARLYAAALAAQPALAEDLQRGHRYNAACVAALAAAGQGKNADQLTAADRANLRRQALAALRADLKLLTRAVAAYQGNKADNPKPASPLEKLGGSPQPTGPADLLRLFDRLRHWQTDADLVSVRQDKQRAQLPPDEQKDWQKLWADVSQLEQQARRHFTETRLEGGLTDKQKQRSHDVELRAGKLYVLDVQSTTFAPLLRLDEAGGQILAKNNSPGIEGSRHAQLLFVPKQDGSHRLTVASVLNQGRGAYVLRIAEFAGATETAPKKEKDASGQ